MYPFSAGRISLIFKKEKEKKNNAELTNSLSKAIFF